MQSETVVRWLARVWGLASILLLLAFMFGGHEQFRPTLNEALALLFFPGGVILGLVLAWWRDLVGGLVVVTSLALFYLLLFAWKGSVPLTPYFLLFAAPGFLHVASALLARKTLAHDWPSPTS